MNFKDVVTALILSVMTLNFMAENYNVTQKEQQQILEEADNWIDEMPDGLYDRLGDAVSHAMHGFSSEIERYRNMADTIGISKYKVKVEDITRGKLGELSLRLYSTNESFTPLLIYFHGGGWSFGSVETTDKFCRALASEGNVKIISVDYALAPENPFPNGLKQCIEAVDYILTKSDEWHFDPKNVSLGGDGAGGNLALGTYSKMDDNSTVKSLVLYYPFINSSGNLDPLSKRKFGRGYGLDSRLWEAFIEAYKDNSTDLNKLGTLPPTLIISAGRDIIIEEERLFSKAFPDITYVLLEGAIHGFITDGHQPIAFNKAVTLTDEFLTR